MRKKRRKSDLWKSMHPRALRRLAFAVFLMFAMLGPLMVLMESKIRIVPWDFLLIQSIACGGFAGCFILFLRKTWLVVLSSIFWMVIVVSNSGGFSIVVNKGVVRTELGKTIGVQKPSDEQAQIVNLTTEKINEIYTQRTMIGLMAIALLGVGYSRFIFVIRSEIKERERLQTEMTIAQNIQQELLPAGVFSNSWCSISGATVPATEVGGDYYDFIGISPSKVAVVIADVAGHGVGSGILSAMTKSALHSELQHHTSPSQLLYSLNNTLYEVSGQNMFVTVAFMLLDREKNTAHITTAGHPPLLYMKQADGVISEFRVPNLALGMKKELQFAHCEVGFQPGDKFLLYTDGVIEAQNSSGDQFGMERLKKVFSSRSNNKEICSTIVAEVKDFTGEDAFKDDVTVVCVNLT